MKRLLLLFLLCCGALEANTPTQIQHRGCPSGANSPSACGGGQCSYATYVCPLPLPILAGNIVIMTGQYATNASVTATITDDKGDTFTIDRKNSADPNQTQIIAHAFPTTGAQVITVTFSGANATFTQWDAAEYNNISGLDTNGCNSNNNTSGSSPNTVTAGNIPTGGSFAASGDLVVQIAVPESGAAVASYSIGTSGQNPNTSWAFRQYDVGYGSGSVAQQAVQWTVYSTTAQFNPTMTIGTPNIAWGSTACAYKANSSGTADPGGARLTGMEHYNIQSVSSNTVTLGAPLSGNLGFLGCITAPSTGPITAVSGSVTGPWTHIGDIANFNGSGVLMLWGKFNTAMSPTDVLTLTTTTNLNVADCVTKGMENMAASPLDTAVVAGTGTTCTSGLCSATGNDTTTTNLATVSLTPSTSTGIVVAMIGVNSPQITGCTQVSDTAYSPQEGTESEMDENNGKCHQPYSSASQITFTWTKGQGAANPGTLPNPGVNGWAAAAVAFKAAAAAAVSPNGKPIVFGGPL